MGFKTMKMGWNISSSPPCVPFYPYTILHNPISWPSHTKCRKTIITQKVLVTPSSNIVHCKHAYPKTYMHRFASLCKHFFSVQIDILFQFLSGGVKFWLFPELPLTKNWKNVNLHREKVFAKACKSAHIGFWVCQSQCTMLDLCVISTFWVIMVFLHFVWEGQDIGLWTML